MKKFQVLIVLDCFCIVFASGGASEEEEEIGGGAGGGGEGRLVGDGHSSWFCAHL